MCAPDNFLTVTPIVKCITLSPCIDLIYVAAIWKFWRNESSLAQMKLQGTRNNYRSRVPFDIHITTFGNVWYEEDKVPFVRTSNWTTLNCAQKHYVKYPSINKLDRIHWPAVISKIWRMKKSNSPLDNMINENSIQLYIGGDRGQWDGEPLLRGSVKGGPMMRINLLWEPRRKAMRWPYDGGLIGLASGSRDSARLTRWFHRGALPMLNRHRDFFWWLMLVC